MEKETLDSFSRCCSRDGWISRGRSGCVRPFYYKVLVHGSFKVRILLKEVRV
jgi:hypothetical protein